MAPVVFDSAADLAANPVADVVVNFLSKAVPPPVVTRVFADKADQKLQYIDYLSDNSVIIVDETPIFTDPFKTQKIGTLIANKAISNVTVDPVTKTIVLNPKSTGVYSYELFWNYAEVIPFGNISAFVLNIAGDIEKNGSTERAGKYTGGVVPSFSKGVFLNVLGEVIKIKSDESPIREYIFKYSPLDIFNPLKFLTEMGNNNLGGSPRV
jgi:hypothetical protein